MKIQQIQVISRITIVQEPDRKLLIRTIPITVTQAMTMAQQMHQQTVKMQDRIVAVSKPHRQQFHTVHRLLCHCPFQR